MPKGYLALVLHAHLPYVRHLDNQHLLEEKWFFEAITETYVPLIKVFRNLVRDNVDFRITLSLSPPLLSMFADPLLQKRYLEHLHKLRELAAKEVARTINQPEFFSVARMYQDLLEDTYKIFFQDYNCSLIDAFKELEYSGHLEVITSAATHGYLPLLALQPEAVKAQISQGIKYFSSHFNHLPAGMWLPECGYYPGLDYVLKEYGIKYFFVDTHGLLYATPRPKYGHYAPITCPSGVAAFGRDLESSKQVWSSQEGYPGDFDYREFYRDIGYDLDWEYIKDYLTPPTLRSDTGFKYYRITGKTEHKLPYIPHHAREKAAIHAGNFMFNRQHQARYLAQHMDRPPIIVSPYDAELFGHWWFEGPQWLDFLIRKIHFDQDDIKMITPGQYLEMYPESQPATPCASSWGADGYNDVWLEGSNDWIYRPLHKAAKKMIKLANHFPGASGITRRALNQAARELLLAQSSDWAFIMKTGTMVQYATERTNTHLERFETLAHSIPENNIDEEYLSKLEEEDNIFPEINYEIYRS